MPCLVDVPEKPALFRKEMEGGGCGGEGRCREKSLVLIINTEHIKLSNLKFVIVYFKNCIDI